MSESRLRSKSHTDHILSALESFASGPKSISEVARHVGVHRSTALRLLRLLERRHFVRREADRRYRLGGAVLALAHQALEDIDLRKIAGPHLLRLNEVTKETVHLAILESDQVLYIDKLDGHSTVRIWSRIGKRGPVHCTGLGKAMAAFLPPDEQRQLAYEVPRERHTSRTITEPEQLLAAFAEARERGWSVDDAEHEELVHCLAAPIRQADGQVLSAISVSSPVTPLESLMVHLPELLATARNISRDYGAIDGGPGGPPVQKVVCEGFRGASRTPSARRPGGSRGSHAQ